MKVESLNPVCLIDAEAVEEAITELLRIDALLSHMYSHIKSYIPNESEHFEDLIYDIAVVRKHLRAGGKSLGVNFES